MDEMVEGMNDRESYFLNFSDGMPMFSNSEINYYHEDARVHTKKMVNEIRKMGVNVLSYFIGDDNKKYKIFGESGVEETAKKYNKEFLGHLPIHQDLRSSADKGDPLTHSEPEHEVSKIFLSIANKIKLSLKNNV